MKSRYLYLPLLLITVVVLHAQIGNELAFAQQWSLAWNPSLAESFADFQFAYAHVPRFIMALLVGAIFGVVGSVMQQLTQNSLTSPLTMGTASGAWLALLIVNIFYPDQASDLSALFAMTGALVAFALVVVIAGFNHLSGLPAIIAGMIVNILLGAFATTLILLHQEYAQNVFMWGAGDLAQNGWEWVSWLTTRALLPLFVVLIFVPRALTLLRLGQAGAKARGMSVIPVFFIVMLLAIWLISASITAVGLIGFIGLITPNVARACGARTAKQELWASLVLGALLLLLTDMLAMLASDWLSQVIPSGVTAALIGAPALIWFSRRSLKADDRLSVSLPEISIVWSKVILGLMVASFVVILILTIMYQPDKQQALMAMPTSYQWDLRWPRGLTALMTGIGLAIAGVILQRLIYNPLASPDLLGVSSGATFSVVLSSFWFGHDVLGLQWFIALLGSLLVLMIIVILARRHNYSPASIVLIGIALSALLQALVQFCLAKANQDSFRIIQWMAGSTYRVSEGNALLLTFLVVVMVATFCVCHRWLNILSIGRDFAASRGVPVQTATLLLLVIVATLCAGVTATVGPIAFVGLISPHLATMLRARQVSQQVLFSTLIGGNMMLWADWLGQVVIFPKQISAGTIVAIIGASYFLLLLLVERLKNNR